MTKISRNAQIFTKIKKNKHFLDKNEKLIPDRQSRLKKSSEFGIAFANIISSPSGGFLISGYELADL